ncbi:hypothetical protein ASF41_15160 [Methylobacterium sp. Leaf111]|nr:hypothetical protein ASF18_12160 [Methylobacterium sp. Leaf89]KQO74634.1 hypothetical protein ASF20_01835 [Methylobacterium sp. Leaf88]KQP75495.1 hypothetical protein ASF41_15160 [Methylobacterium sp. Leaf111]KQU32025.1 hypothetical protein ASG63_16145 [Methylobacterium sp. Leaf94]
MSAPLLSAGALAIVMTSSVQAQGVLAPHDRRGVIIQNQPNTTGNSRDLVISYGATGADTVTTNSAAGGNASRPEQAFPNGSANGGPGGR